MPNSKSAMKRAKQNVKRRTRNRHVKSTMRSQIKKVRAAIEAGDATVARESLPVAVRLVQRAASKGVIHANTAQRMVSRLTIAVQKLGGEGEAAA
ncbi:MAG: 30S ribosomal protein S20 [bacterium]